MRRETKEKAERVANIVEKVILMKDQLVTTTIDN